MDDKKDDSIEIVRIMPPWFKGVQLPDSLKWLTINPKAHKLPETMLKLEIEGLEENIEKLTSELSLLRKRKHNEKNEEKEGKKYKEKKEKNEEGSEKKEKLSKKEKKERKKEKKELKERKELEKQEKREKKERKERKKREKQEKKERKKQEKKEKEKKIQSNQEPKNQDQSNKEQTNKDQENNEKTTEKVKTTEENNDQHNKETLESQMEKAGGPVDLTGQPRKKYQKSKRICPCCNVVVVRHFCPHTVCQPDCPIKLAYLKKKMKLESESEKQ